MDSLTLRHHETCRIGCLAPLAVANTGKRRPPYKSGRRSRHTLCHRRSSASIQASFSRARDVSEVCPADCSIRQLFGPVRQTAWRSAGQILSYFLCKVGLWRPPRPPYFLPHGLPHLSGPQGGPTSHWKSWRWMADGLGALRGRSHPKRPISPPDLGEGHAESHAKGHRCRHTLTHRI